MILGSLHTSGLKVFLGIIPSPSGIRTRNRHLHSRNQTSGQNTSNSLNSEKEPEKNRGANHQKSRTYHFPQGSCSGNSDTGSKIRVFSPILDILVSQLSSHFSDHFLSSLAYRFHSHSTEPIRQHSSNQQTRKHHFIHHNDSSIIRETSSHKSSVQR